MKKVNVTLLVLTAIAMAVGTFLSVDGYYGAWWFVALLALDAVAAVVTIVQRKYWREPHNLLIYASVPIMLLGGGLTMLTGEQDTLVLQPGEEQEGVTLERFEVVNYPGTQTPMDFVSQVTIDGEPYTISMNNIARHKGYRYYQEDYDGAGGSTLRVAHDPWGIGVTYAGYALLVAGLAWMFLSRKSRFRRLLKGTAVLALLFLAQTATAAPHTLGSTSGRRPSVPRDVAAKMGEQYVLYKGRVCPMQTLAKDFSTKLYGKATYQGLTAEQVLAGWMFYYGDWAEEAMPKGKNQRATEEKQALVQMVANSTLLKMFPLRDSTGVLQWYSQNDPLSLSVGEEEYIFVRKQLGYCQELVVKGDFETLAMVFDKTRQYQEKQAGEVLPSAARLKAERLYNGGTLGYAPAGGGDDPLPAACLCAAVGGRRPCPNGGRFRQHEPRYHRCGHNWACRAASPCHSSLPKSVGHGLLSARRHDERCQPTGDEPDAGAQFAALDAACGGHHDGLRPLPLRSTQQCCSPAASCAAREDAAHHAADALPRRGAAGRGHHHRRRVGQHLVGHLLVVGPQGGLGADYAYRLPLSVVRNR